MLHLRRYSPLLAPLCLGACLSLPMGESSEPSGCVDVELPPLDLEVDVDGCSLEHAPTEDGLLALRTKLGGHPFSMRYAVGSRFTFYSRGTVPFELSSADPSVVEVLRANEVHLAQEGETRIEAHLPSVAASEDVDSFVLRSARPDALRLAHVDDGVGVTATALELHEETALDIELLQGDEALAHLDAVEVEIVEERAAVAGFSARIETRCVQSAQGAACPPCRTELVLDPGRGGADVRLRVKTRANDGPSLELDVRVSEPDVDAGAPGAPAADAGSGADAGDAAGAEDAGEG